MKIKGFIKFSTNKGKNVEVENNTTLLGNMLFNAQAKRFYAMQKGIEEGMDFIISPMYSYDNGTNLQTINNGLTVYLLNLTQAEIDDLTVDSQLLPIFTAGTFEIDSSKIVGWASMARISSQAKEGIVAQRAGEMLLDEWISSQAWTWEAGKAVGSFNCIAIGFNLVNSGSNRYNGTAIYRGLENNDVIGGELPPGGYMARPGINGITGNNEILIGGKTSDDYALGRVKLDLVSKTRTELTAEDTAYNFPLVKANVPQIIDNNKMYYPSGNRIFVYDMITKTHTNTNIPYSTSYVNFFIYNDFIYVGYSSSTLRAYNKTTYAYTSSANKTISDILALPSDLTTGTLYFGTDNIEIGNYGNGQYIITRRNQLNRIKERRAVVVTDPFTANSIVKILPCVGSVVNYTVNNEIYLFDYEVRDDLYQGSIYGLGGNIYRFGEYGVKYSKYSGNMLSFKVFDTPQIIEADEVARVEYSYKYGE